MLSSTSSSGTWSRSGDAMTTTFVSTESPAAAGVPPTSEPDRKSTRLNSSHLVISYAVFCLKKKKKKSPPGRASPPLTQPSDREFTTHPRLHGWRDYLVVAAHVAAQTYISDAEPLSSADTI